MAPLEEAPPLRLLEKFIIRNKTCKRFITSAGGTWRGGGTWGTTVQQQDMAGDTGTCWVTVGPGGNSRT